jgi:hypothetical protein
VYGVGPLGKQYEVIVRLANYYFLDSILWLYGGNLGFLT